MTLLLKDFCIIIGLCFFRLASRIFWANKMKELGEAIYQDEINKIEK